MKSDLIREISQQIVRDEILLNWKFYLLILILSFFASAIGSWVGAYYKRRGQISAAKTDFAEILRQVSETTKATEQLKTAISTADWAAREWRKTRQVKLEELLDAAFSLDRWVDSQRGKWIHDSKEEVESPLERLRVLGALYFPELKGEVDMVFSNSQQSLSLILEVSQKTTSAKASGDMGEFKRLMQEMLVKWEPMYKAAHKSVIALRDQAEKLMGQLAGV